MKVIDLLNKKANGEKTPAVFKIGKWKYDSINGNEKLDYELFGRLLDEDIDLNDEVEIIEDYKVPEIPYGYCQVLDSEIEKINIRVDSTGTEYVVGKRFGKAFGKAYLDYAEKINEIIDVVNQLKKQPSIININGLQPPIMQGPYKITCDMESKGE